MIPQFGSLKAEALLLQSTMTLYDYTCVLNQNLATHVDEMAMIRSTALLDTDLMFSKQTF